MIRRRAIVQQTNLVRQQRVTVEIEETLVHVVVIAEKTHENGEDLAGLTMWCLLISRGTDCPSKVRM